jgi:catechol 2,3-dioxygenase
MTLPYGVRPPGYRLPDDTSIGAVRLQVADLDRSVRYYQSVIGLTLLTQAQGVVTLGAPDGVPLVHLHGEPRARPAPKGAIGLYHFAILLPDRAALGRFAAHVMRNNIRVGMSDHLVSESFYLTDPDGLGIEVYADRPASTWQNLGRELAMAVDPLDVRSVIASGGGLDWTGAPAGTVMGHVHLHVGDIDAASSYYHGALGFDRIVWSFPGALFLSAGGYHHHLGTNTWSSGPPPAADQARLLEWEILLPGADDVAAAASSLESAGWTARQTERGWMSADPWGTTLRIVPRADR